MINDNNVPSVFLLDNLKVSFSLREEKIEAVKGVSLDINASECVGIVGESGSGKSQTFLAAMGLVAQNGSVEGRALFNGEDLLSLEEKKLRYLRGNKISMIFQDPLTSLTPHMKIAEQMLEVLDAHGQEQGAAALQKCHDLLELVRIPEAKHRLNQYPHELSGGMRQRVMIAMALLGDPELLIADEPTTALDVTVQAQILDILKELQEERKMALALITHDMGVVARMCDRVMVMRDGEIVEKGDVQRVFYHPQEEYTKRLLSAMPRLDSDERAGRSQLKGLSGHEEIILSVDDLKVHYPVEVGKGLIPKRKMLKAVDGVNFQLRRGETLGIVGESGCGKSTLARAVLQLAPSSMNGDDGPIVWLGKDLSKEDQQSLRSIRKSFQIVFQDPLAALDPRMTIGESVAEPVKTHLPEVDASLRDRLAGDMLERVGLSRTMINRYPHELSGGQNQRVGIARAMILKPQLVICDEAVSALDVSIQAEIIDLLIDLQKEFDIALLFISHDLAVVREISHRVMVLYLGQVVEIADRDEIYRSAQHPYTKALISAVPTPDPVTERKRERVKLEGDLPSPLDSRASLRFLKSKLIDDPDVEQYRPKFSEVSPTHFVAEHDS